MLFILVGISGMISSKPIKTYAYTGYGSLKVFKGKSWCFKTLEEAITRINISREKGFFKTVQIVFIDYSVAPSRILHISEPIITP